MVRAVYDGIYRAIRERIEEGAYAYQDFLPSENEFIAEFSCSHNTIRKALALLAQEGYVHPIQGKGVRVIYQPLSRAGFVLGGIESFKETAARNHLNASTRVSAFERRSADERVARLTGFSLGDELVYLERVRVLDGKALILDRSYFLANAVEGLTPQIAEKSIYDFFENELGITIATSKRAITAERATELDRRLLDLDGYDFLAVVTGQVFRSDGIMIECTQSRHRPDHFIFYSTATRGV